MRLRRQRNHRFSWLTDLPGWQQIALGAVGSGGIAALAYVGRRRLWQALGLVASAVEEVADTVEDAAEDVRDAARERAGVKS